MIRVLVAEDLHVVRAGLVLLLDEAFDIEVVADVSSGDAVIPAALARRPDVAVLDIGMPGTDGLTTALRLRERLPDCRSLLLTAMDRPGHLRRALDAGLPGFLLKSVAPERLLEAVRTVAGGGRMIDPALLDEAWAFGECPLTERETEILRLAGDGADAREIAVGLSLSIGTVRNRLSDVIRKLHARTLVDAVRIAGRNGWT
ncbi:response regulator transcription factor [Streptomyces uncialis]|uniref:MerR family transcriptional regulator n=1 Tax=Streptomyces uncialis TaxID=1048205 RepID=A0A1Q4VF50_9ACTN|nr:response regulator transcription factor [Streptomyces uncialis]MCX4660170.1 response regulator transcription factor [Streptomyces uncialis]OKH96441.1 MerR family transcriptional regulator [Streptomyces uncialis]WTE13147.1 response regulator transcription factor [Streptomyces uncialis]